MNPAPVQAMCTGGKKHEIYAAIFSMAGDDWALLAFTANSAAQSSAQTHIHSAIVVIDTSNNAWHSQVHWLVETPHLVVKASNGLYLF